MKILKIFIFICLFVPSYALAKGLKNPGTSISAHGSAGAAGVTISDDASSISLNPAHTSNLQPQATFGTFIQLNDSEMTDSTRSHHLQEQGIEYQNNNKSNNATDIQGSVTSLNTFGVYTIDEDFDIALGITSPWNLQYSFDQEWIGEYYSKDLKIESVNISPIVSYRINPDMQVAFGFQYQTLDLDFSYDIDFASIPIITEYNTKRDLDELEDLSELVGTADGELSYSGSSAGTGFVLGYLWQINSRYRLGLSMTSAVMHEIKGNILFNKQKSEIFSDTLEKYSDQIADLKISTPATYKIGLSTDEIYQFKYMLSYSYTNWATSFNELNLKGSSLPENELHALNWSSSHTLCAGFEFKNLDFLKYRAGLSFESSSEPEKHKQLLLLPESSFLFAFGATYYYNKELSLDAAYSHSFAQTSEINISSDPVENQRKGNFKGKFISSANNFGLQLNYKL